MAMSGHRTDVRRLAVMTTTRADYGLLRELIRILKDAPDVTLQMIVSGTHLAAAFGQTVKDIEVDGHEIAAKVDLDLAGGRAVDAARSAGLGTIRFAEAFSKLTPDLLVLLGDRYEILAAATAATLLNVPIAHIHGGEVTSGAFDDQIRHAVTKLSLIHFVAAEPYRRRVIQLGEDPDLVFNVGAPGLDQIQSTALEDRTSIGRTLGLQPESKYVVVTLHPTTSRPDLDQTTIDALLSALQGTSDVTAVFTGVNADPGHDLIAAAVRDYVDRNPSRSRLFPSLGSARYLSAVQHAEAVIGNSSSGIIEAPVLNTPTINIGDRQAGRLRAASIVDCEPDLDAISAALQRVRAPEFRERTRRQELPYGRAGASARIAEILRKIDFRRHLPKRFRDY
jgi:UDP-hydrolysing UDP-N-acetyl-D-glucosamine 2-epimerase